MGNRCGICTQGDDARRLADQGLQDGLPLRTIAHQLGVSHTSVMNHRDNCDKLVNFGAEVAKANVEAAQDAAASIDVGKYIRGMDEAFDGALALAQDKEVSAAVRVAAYRVVTQTGVQIVEAIADERHRQEIRERIERLSEIAENPQLLTQQRSEPPPEPTADWTPESGL